MESAKANNLRLEDYIEHLLAVLPERFADDLEADIDDLLPWADAMQKRFAMFGTGTQKSAYLSHAPTAKAGTPFRCPPCSAIRYAPDERRKGVP